MTLAFQPSGLQSQGPPAPQFPSPIEQVSQWFASPVPGPQFTPLHTGFTPPQSSSVLTLVSRSLGASFSELIGQPTLPELHVLGPSTVAPITGTTEMLPSSVASLEQAAPVLDLTQTASASLPATEGQTA